MSYLAAARERLAGADPVAMSGRVRAVRGLTMLVDDLPAAVGRMVRIGGGASEVIGEVVGFDGRTAIVMPMDQADGVRPGDRVVTCPGAAAVNAGTGLLGRVIDALGRPLDHAPQGDDVAPAALMPRPLGALDRARIESPMATGVRALDVFTTLGRGQRIGLFAGPGVGKSTLLGMIAQRARCDVNVIALIGERGREVGDFIAHALGPEGMARSVVVVSTSDESPVKRVRAANAACAVAEHFRDRGKHVMLMIDSVTRFAHAQRQIGLASGEPPATRGYTPSVFSSLSRLLERAGAVTGEGGAGGRGAGSITGIYTVLVEGDEMTEPVSDAVRGILDGHVMLSRTLAQRGHYPAIDVLDSISRLADGLIDEAHRRARRTLVRLLAAYKEVEELVQIGAYAKGSNPIADVAIELRPRIEALLRQGGADMESLEGARAKAVELAGVADVMLAGGRRPAGKG